MKKIMIILIPLFLLACTTSNTSNDNYITKQEFDEYKSSMEQFIKFSNENIHTNQKELTTKTDKHQLDINALVKDLDSLYQKVSSTQNYEDAEVLKNMIIKVEALETKTEQLSKSTSSDKHTHSSIPSHTHTSSSYIPSHTHTSIPSHTHPSSSSNGNNADLENLEYKLKGMLSDLKKLCSTSIPVLKGYGNNQYWSSESLVYCKYVPYLY